MNELARNFLHNFLVEFHVFFEFLERPYSAEQHSDASQLCARAEPLPQNLPFVACKNIAPQLYRHVVTTVDRLIYFVITVIDMERKN